MEPGAARPGDDLVVHGRFLRGLARALVGDAHADDVVQETWANALASPPRHADAPRAWLARILRRVAIRRGVREGERGAREGLAAASTASAAPAPDEWTAEIELSRRVLEAVERLREPYRGTLFLRYWRGLEPQRIAADTATPVKTVKTRLARGLELLRADLDRVHGERSTWVALLLPLARAAPVASVPPPPVAAPTLAAPGAVLALALAATAVTIVVAVYATRAGAPAPERVAAEPTPVAPARSSEPAGDAAPSNRRALAETAALAPAFTGVRLSGRVLDEGGAPLAAAEVAAVPLGSGRREGRGAPGPSGTPEEGPAVRTTSDAAGAFELVLEGAGLVRLDVEHDGFAPLGHRMLVFAGQELDLGALELAAGACVVGRVVDEEGAPVAGAALVVERTDGGLVLDPDGRRAALAAVSDAAGAFRIARLAAGEWRVVVGADGYAPAEAGGTCAAGETTAIEIALVHGAEVRGHVEGRGARAGLRVVARVLGGPAGEPAEPRQALTDAAGAFVLGGLAPGAEVELFALDVDAPRGARSEPVRVRAGGDDDVVLELAERQEPAPRHVSAPEAAPAGGAPGTIEVLVLDAAGVPVRGALVACRPRAGDSRRGPGAEVRAADAEGRVRFEDLAPGTHAVAVVTGSLGLFDEDVRWREVGLAAGERARVELARAAVASLAGRVRRAGVAVEGARVLLRPRAGAPRGRGGPELALATRSDSAGAFAFADLPPGEYEVELEHASLARPWRDGVTLRADGAELAIELGDARLRGWVADDAGNPLVGARVRVLDEREGGPRSVRRSSGPEREGAAVTTDASGAFELVGLEPGVPLRIEVTCAGHASQRSGEVLPDGELGLAVALAPAAPLALRVTSTVHPFVLLRATGPAGEERFLPLRTDHAARLDDLGAGTWRLVLEARADRGAPAALGERTVELVAGRTTELLWELP